MYKAFSYYFDLELVSVNIIKLVARLQNIFANISLFKNKSGQVDLFKLKLYSFESR